MAQESNQRPEDVQIAAKTEERGAKTQADESSPQKTGKEPSGSKGDDPSTAGPGKTSVHSTTTENATGRLNPSAPEDANVTPGSAGVK